MTQSEMELNSPVILKPKNEDSKASKPTSPSSRRISRVDKIQRFQSSAILAYVTILALQLVRIWNIWEYHDLTFGDTSFYFMDAWRWYTHHQINIAWSPLYSIFYGSFLWLSRDAYVVTTLHRVVIVMGTTMLVLAVMRRLLPASIAWLMAAWWAILPINFDTLYEIHLFSVMPILVVWLIALRPNPGVWTRAAVLSLLLLVACLVRNELIIAVFFFATVCLVMEWRRLRQRATAHAQNRGKGLLKTTAIYIAVIGIALLVIFEFYRDSIVKGQALAQSISEKHTVNMAQVYTFGYQQRHPEWDKNPWLDWAELSQKMFGTSRPSLFIMARENPKELAAHVLWNLSLVPNGLQILLFNESSGTTNPDYTLQNILMGRHWALADSLLVIAVVLAGGWILWKTRDRWRSEFISRSLGWWAMLAVVAVSPAIVITQRPRPCYFFSTSVFCMAIIGTALWILLRQFRIERFLWIPMLPVMLVAWMLASNHYVVGAPLSPPLLLTDYHRLIPFQSDIQNPKTVFLKGEYAEEIKSYIGLGSGISYSYGEMFPQWHGQSSLVDFFQSKNANMVFLNASAINIINVAGPDALEQFINQGGAEGWHLVGSGQGRDPWLFFEKTDRKTSGTTLDLADAAGK